MSQTRGVRVYFLHQVPIHMPKEGKEAAGITWWETVPKSHWPQPRSHQGSLRKGTGRWPWECCVTPDRATTSPYPPLSGTVQKALWMRQASASLPAPLPRQATNRNTRAQAETGIHHLVHPLVGRGPGSPSPADQT